MFTVKSYDTKSAINQVKGYVDGNALIITVQNGINNDLLLSEAFGQRVIPGYAKGGYSCPRPGYFRNTGFAILTVGEYDGRKSFRLIEFVRICQIAGIEAAVSSNIQTERWKKYILNCTFNIISAITRLSVDRMLDYSKVHDLCTRTMKEIISVAKTEGVVLNEEDTIRETIALIEKLGTFKPSTLQDIEKGKPIELEAFTGYVIKLARKHDLPVPINELFYILLSGITLAK